jgi:hypothetical protein
MIERQKIEEIILEAVANLNAERPPDAQIVAHEATVLFGRNSVFDSISLVSVIVDVETMLNSRLHLEVSLTDDRAMNRARSPYSTVGTLRDYVVELLAERV